MEVPLGKLDLVKQMFCSTHWFMNKNLSMEIKKNQQILYEMSIVFQILSSWVYMDLNLHYFISSKFSWKWPFFFKSQGSPL